MLCFQGLAVQSFLHDAFPSDDPIPGSTNFVAAHHLFQKVLCMLLLFSGSIQLLTNGVILRQQFRGSWDL